MANRSHQSHSCKEEDGSNNGYTKWVLSESQPFIEDRHNAYGQANSANDRKENTEDLLAFHAN